MSRVTVLSTMRVCCMEPYALVLVVVMLQIVNITEH